MRPRLGLKPTHAAPTRRQADRSSYVGAEMDRPVPGGAGGAGAGAAAAGALAQVPRVAREFVKTRQARRQHAVVGHRGLGQTITAPASRRRAAGGASAAAGVSTVAAAAERRRRAAGGDVLLDRHRHAVECARPGHAASASSLSRAACKRGVGIQRPGRVRCAARSARCVRADRASRRPATASPDAYSASSSTALRSCSAATVRRLCAPR